MRLCPSRSHDSVASCVWNGDHCPGLLGAVWEPHGYKEDAYIIWGGGGGGGLVCDAKGEGDAKGALQGLRFASPQSAPTAPAPTAFIALSSVCRIQSTAVCCPPAPWLG